MSNFYITLPSNTTNFKVNLPKTLEFKDKWEVSLSEFTYPMNTWLVPEPVEIYLRDFGCRSTWAIMEIPKLNTLPIVEDPIMISEYKGYLPMSYQTSSIPTVFKTFLPAKNYESYLEIWEEVIKIVNGKLESGSGRIKFAYEFDGETLSVFGHEIATPIVVVFTDPILAERLGIPQLFSDERRNRTVKFSYGKLPDGSIDKTTKIKVKVHDESKESIYLFTDIIKHQVTGQDQSQLLRTIPLRGKRNEIQNIAFDKRYYFPIQYGYINSISINIRNSQGKLVKFDFGKFIVVLHFRISR